MHYSLEPEVPGELLPGTNIDNTCRPPLISSLAVIFEGWLGDDLLEIYPCFFVTDRLRRALEHHRVPGCQFESFSLQLGDGFPLSASGTQFWRLWPIADNQVSGISLGDRGQLLASEGAVKVLTQWGLKYCDISPTEAPQSRARK